MGWYYGFRPYVSVAQRRANAAREVAKLAKKGHAIAPVRIDGREIARTFWGKAWCENLESYSDFANRLPRGRTYVRNGSVVDLQVHPGKVTARVSGSELYDINIKIKPLSRNRWQALSAQCAGKIASVLELLQGRLSQGVMEIITHREHGLFPKPSEISLDCSCPDWADMCKHVAAALYGVGARLDEKPELLFVLRRVDHMELIEQAAAGRVFVPAAASDKKTIADSDLAEVFGIELDGGSSPAVPRDGTPAAAAKAAADRTARNTTRRKTPAERAGTAAGPAPSARRKAGRGKAGGRKGKRRTRTSRPASRRSRKPPKAI
jgi:uncharacterized Zn finger protein